MITVHNHGYELVENYREAFNDEAFEGRYSEILHKYDYIVGDWGYGQLRLKGFFDDHNQKSSFDTKISTVRDYLYEYCNFGCPFFILKKVEVKKPEATKEQPKKEAQQKEPGSAS